MRSRPLVASMLPVLGLASLGTGMYYMLRSCSGLGCVVRALGALMVGWGVAAVGSLLRNGVGIVCLLTALSVGIFVGLVFAFARVPAGLLPPLAVGALALLEREEIVAYYFPGRARAPEEVPR